MLQMNTQEQTNMAAGQVSLHGLMDKLFNRPLAISPDYFQTLMGALAFRLNLQQVSLGNEIVTAEKLRLKAESFSGRERKSYQVTSDGVAVLPITGSLVHKYGYLQPYSGMTGYDGIKARLHQALNDEDVSSILLDFDSPGGEVAGCFVLAREMQKLKGGKPIWSMFDELSTSAAFALASASDRRIITTTGYAGSVGVLTAHVDRSQMMEKNGLNVTLLHSGKHKVDGNGYEALPDDVRASIETELNSLRVEFAELVASGTKLSAKAVLDTEAQVYRGAEAVTVGFADAVGTPAETLAELAELGRNKKKGKKTFAATTQENSMKDGADNTGAGAANASGSEDLNTQADATGLNAAAEAKARIKGILGHAEAKGRSDLANHLAFETDLSVDAAAAMLSKAAKSTGDLDNMMDKDHKPLGSDEEQTGGAKAAAGSRVADAQAALKARNKTKRKGG